MASRMKNGCGAAGGAGGSGPHAGEARAAAKAGTPGAGNAGAGNAGAGNGGGAGNGSPAGARNRGVFQAGFTLAELVMVAAIMASLTLIAMPVVKYTRQRSKEMELHQDLRMMRAAIDEYKRYSDQGLLPVDLGTEGYPKDLDILVKGVELVGQIDKKKKFLRRIPLDPMTSRAQWGLRSYQDDFDSSSTGGEDVYDVYSLSPGVGLNGTPYRKW